MCNFALTEFETDTEQARQVLFCEHETLHSQNLKRTPSKLDKSYSVSTKHCTCKILRTVNQQADTHFLLRASHSLHLKNLKHIQYENYYQTTVGGVLRAGRTR